MMVNNGWVGFGAAKVCVSVCVGVKRYKVSVMRGDIISEAGELPVGCPHSEFQASQDYIWKPNFRKKKFWVEGMCFLRFTG